MTHRHAHIHYENVTAYAGGNKNIEVLSFLCSYAVPRMEFLDD